MQNNNIEHTGIALDPKIMKSLADMGRQSLFFFARGILGFSDFTSHIHKPICDKLQEDDLRRFLIVLPRDWFKSTIGSVAYPLWRAINDTNVRILVVQNSMSNARKKLQSIKQIVEKNKLLRALYPEILPGKNSTWTADCLTLNREGAFPEGTFEAAGTGTAVISRHYDLIVQDDTVSPAIDDMTGLVQQPTQAEIEKAIGFHRLAHPLLLHPKYSKIVVIGTRWCERDLIGWIQENTDNFTVLSRSARENGEIVWPERYDEEVLYEIENSIGPYMFSTLFLNEPLNDINGVFRREWINYYQNLPQSNKLAFCTSVDPACSDSDNSSNPDYTVVLTTAYDKKTGLIYVVHYDRGRYNPGETIDAIFNHVTMFSPLEVKVEAIAYQRTLCYWLKKRQDALHKYFFINPIKGLKGSKVDRVKGLQPFFACDKVLIKSSHHELEREILGFPNAAHDDIVDALSMHREFWYQLGQEEEKIKKQSVSTNDLTGSAVIKELLGRPKKLNRYPYDIGLMAERERNNQLREYQYA